MPTKDWKTIENDPDYQALSDGEQRQVKYAFFRKVVAPTPEFKRLPKEGQQYLVSNFLGVKVKDAPKRESLGDIAKTELKKGFDNNLTGSIANKAVREGMAALPAKAKPLAQQWTETQQRRIDYSQLQPPKPILDQAKEDLAALRDTAVDTAVGMQQNLSTGTEGLGEGVTAWLANMAGQGADPAAFGVAKAAGKVAQKAVTKGVNPTLAHGVAALGSGATQGGGTSLAQGDTGSVTKNAVLGALLEVATAGHAPAPARAATVPVATPPKPVVPRKTSFTADKAAAAAAKARRLAAAAQVQAEKAAAYAGDAEKVKQQGGPAPLIALPEKGAPMPRPQVKQIPPVVEAPPNLGPGLPAASGPIPANLLPQFRRSADAIEAANAAQQARLAAIQAADAANKADPSFPDLDELTSTLDAQARVHGAPGAAYEPNPVPVEPGLLEPAGQRGERVKSTDERRQMFKLKVPPAAIRIDPDAYQFKRSGFNGKTERLDGVEEWDSAANAVNPVLLHQRKDGSIYVVDGHQRVNLAQRLQREGKPVPDLNALVINEKDGWDIPAARNLGAKINIQQGTGTAVDVAKVIKDGGLSSQDMRQMPKQGDSARAFRDGQELANLGDRAFALVANEIVAPGDPRRNAMIGAVVARNVKEPAIQAAILEDLAKDAPHSEREVELTVRQLVADGHETYTQTGLFGSDIFARSNARDIARLMTSLESDLKGDKTTAAKLIRQGDRITAIEGNQLNQDANRAVLDEAKRLEFALDKLGTTDQTFRDTLREIAKAQKAGDLNKRQALAEARTALNEALERVMPSEAPATVEIRAQEPPRKAYVYNDVAGDAPEPTTAPDVEPQPEGPRVSSDQMGLFGGDPLLKFMADETGSASIEGALGLVHVRAAVDGLRAVWRRMVQGEDVNPKQVEQAALKATAAEMKGQASVAQIRAKAAERTRLMREAAKASHNQGIGAPQRLQQAQPAPAKAQESPAPRWEDIANDPDYLELTPAEQRQVQDAYSDKVEAQGRSEQPAPEPVPQVERPAIEASQAAPRTEAPSAPKAVASGKAPSEIDPDKYFNVGKMNLSERGQQIMRRIIRDDVAQNGWDPKRVVPQSTYVEEARKMGLDASMLRVPEDGETITPTVHAKLKMELKGINEQMQNLEAQINRRWSTATAEEIEAAQRQYDDLDRDAREILNVLIPARSQDGRNLAFHRWMAESSFDHEFWVARARRMAGNGPDTPIANEAAFRSILTRGQQAQDRMEGIIAQLEHQGINDHGIDPNNPDLDMPRDRRGPTLEQFLEDEGGFFDLGGFLNTVNEWSMGLNGKASGPDAKHRLKTYPSADPEVRDLVRQGRIAAAEVRAARIEMALTLAKLERTPKLVVLSAARKVGLLLNPGTIGMNFAGGAGSIVAEGVSKVPAMGIDPLVGWIFGEASDAGKVRTGRRTVDVNWKSVGQASRQAATKGVRDALQVMGHGMTRDQLAKMDIPNEINSGNQLIDNILNFGFRTASAPDRIPYNYALEASLREQARLMAAHERRVNRGLDVNKRAEEIYQGVINPAGSSGKAVSDEMRTAIVTRANDDAMFATFTNETLIGNILSGIPGIVSKSKSEHVRAMKPAVDFLYDQVVTFKGLPGAVAQRVLDYSLVGLGARTVWHIGNGDLARVWKKGLTYGEQRAISMAIGRGATGLGLMMLGLAFADRGWIEGAYDQEARDINETAGRIPSSVKIKFPWMKEARFVPIGQISPIGNMLVVGSMLRQVGSNPFKVGFAALRTAADSPMTQGIKAAADAWGDEAGLAKFGSQWAGSWIPSAVGQIAKAVDPSRAEPEIRKDHALEDGIKARLPYVRNGMPRKQSVLGEPIEAASGWDAFNRFFGRAAIEDSDPVIAELVRINRALPPGEKLKITKPTDSYTIAKERVKLTPELTRELDMYTGRHIKAQVRKLMALPNWENLSDEQKATAIDKREKLVKEAVKESFGKRYRRELVDLYRQQQRQKRTEHEAS